MKFEHDPVFLRELCEKVVADPDLQPKDGLTWCNKAVDRIALSYAKYSGFEGMLANDIHAKMKRSLYWQELQSDEAAGASMVGGLVIASRPAEPHGHVAVLFPDKPSKNGHPFMVFSGKWSLEVPRVANVGHKNGLMGVNYAFKDIPTYFAYVPRKQESSK